MFKEEYKNKLSAEDISDYCFKPDRDKVYLILRLFNDGHLKTINELYSLLSPLCWSIKSRGHLREYIKRKLDYSGLVETRLDQDLIGLK